VLALVGALSGACGAGPPTSESTIAYFEAFASNDPDRFEEMLAAAEPGSLAHGLAGHLMDLLQVSADDAERPATELAGTLDSDGRRLSIVYGSDRSHGYDDLDVDPSSGRLRSFSERFPADADPRVPLSETFVTGGHAPVSALDATFQLISARKPHWSPQLHAVVEVRAGSQALRVNAVDRPLVTLQQQTPSGALTTYLTAEGEEQVLHAVSGPTDVDAGQTVRLVLVFEDVQLGGSIIVPIGSEGELVEVEIAVPAPPS
jgi:hypothetical protein